MRLKYLVQLGLSIVTLFLATHAGRANAATNRYPSVRPTQKTFDVPDVQKMDVLLLIRSKAGKPLYRLRCAHPGYDGDYSGDFECRLDTTESDDPKVENTLLIEDASQLKQWPSRGRFFAADLVGKCAVIPGFGATRDFRLRGMDLRLQVADPVIDPSHESWVGAGDPTLKSMTLKVTVRPDPSATRSIAAIVPFPSNPPTQCGIHPGEWPVGALGAVGHPLKDISYFGDPITFTKGNPLPSVDWRSIPFGKPGEWNHGMRVGEKPKHCSAQLDSTTTFRGELIPQKFHIYDPRLHTKTNKYVRYQAVLKLGHPINVCGLTPAPHLSTSEKVNKMRAYNRAHNIPVPTRAQAVAILAALSKLPPPLPPVVHITSLEVDWAEIYQLGAFNTKYIGHKVEITGKISSQKDPQMEPYHLQYDLYASRICLFQNGKQTACLSDLRPL